MATRQGPSAAEKQFTEERGQDIEHRINANPHVVAALKAAHAQESKTMVPARKFFEENVGTDL